MRDDAAQLFERARLRLAAAPREALGEIAEPSGLRRVLGVGPRIVRAGSAWRVGSLLIGDDVVHEAGEVLRATDPGRRGYAAESARRRAELRAMALRGGFAEGETVHLGWWPLDLAGLAAGEPTGPLSWQDGRVMIRWTPAGALMPLSAYLDERVGLLLAPPPGA
ncbi:glutaminase [Microbacterium marinilacus]|uniref:Glutaminase n=1 Tax=Microbacterium marinilacus TaxID=415209 RepID=A0ABP7BMH4_9MICO|nr:glutaminase [Microbacterium marinilacus]MBY0690426.1 glutaminase [Microbacterium marinilacus]